MTYFDMRRALRWLRSPVGGLLYLMWMVGSSLVAQTQTSAPALEWELEVGGGHRGGVTRVAYSADGQTAFSVGQDGALKKWELSSGQLLASWDSNTSSLSALEMSPDGRIMAVGGNDGSIQIRNAETGRVIQLLKAHDSEVTSVAFSADGKQLASVSKDLRVRIWSPYSGKEVRTLTGVARALNAVVFGPDDKVLYAAGAEGRILRWNLSTGKPLRPLEVGETTLTSLAIAPNGRYLVAGSWDQLARLWDLKSDKLVRTFQFHKNWVTDVAFSPDGFFLATAGRDREVALWNLKNPKPLSIWRGHAGMISSVHFSPDGLTLLSGSWDGTARQWSTGLPTSPELGGQLRMVLRGGSMRVTSLAWTPDARRLALGHPDGAIVVWDIASGSVVQTLKGGWTPVRALGWGPGGVLVMGSEEGSVLVWNTEGGVRRKQLSGHTASITAVSLNSDGSVLATASLDKTVRLWKMPSGEPIRTLTLKAAPLSMTFSPDGKGVIVGTGAGELSWYSVETGTADKPFLTKGPAVQALSLARTGKQLAVALGSGSIALFTVEDRKQVQTLLGHSGPVLSLSYRPDGKRLVSAGSDLTLRWWDPTRPEGDVRRMNVLVPQVAWSPDGSAVAAGADGLKLLHPSRNEELSTLHRLGDYSLRTTPQGMFSGPEPVSRQVYYRRYERVRAANEAPLCSIPEGFPPLVPPTRAPACNAQLNGKPVDRLDELLAPRPAPALVHLVGAGVGEYEHNSPSLPLNLKYGAKDVKRVVEQLQRLFGKSLEVQGGKPLLDKDATRENILNALESALQRANGKPQELVILYMVSRGGNDGTEFSLFPHDYDPESPLLTRISQTRLSELLARYDARVLLILDAGQPTVSQQKVEERDVGLARLAFSRQKTWILISSRGEDTYEGRRFCRWGGGAFSCAFMDALRGKADRAASQTGEGDGILTAEEVVRFLAAEVPYILERRAPQGAVQQPVLLQYGGGLTLWRR